MAETRGSHLSAAGSEVGWEGGGCGVKEGCLPCPAPTPAPSHFATTVLYYSELLSSEKVVLLCSWSYLKENHEPRDML